MRKTPRVNTRFCKDCNLRFTIYARRKRRYYYCPYCGDHINVVMYEKDIRIAPDATPRRSWTTQEVKQLEEQIKKGRRPSELTAMFNRTQSSINKKAWRLGYRFD